MSWIYLRNLKKRAIMSKGINESEKQNFWQLFLWYYAEVLMISWGTHNWYSIAKKLSFESMYKDAP